MEQTKRIGNEVVTYGASNLLTSVATFLIIALLTRELQQEDYGVWVQIGVTTELLLRFVTLGFDTAVVRFLSGLEDRKLVGGLFHGMIIVTGAVSLLLIAASYLFDNYLSSIVFGRSGFERYVVLAAYLLAGRSLVAMLRGFLRSIDKIVIFSIVHIAIGIARIVATFLVLKMGYGLLQVVQMHVLIEFFAVAWMYLFYVVPFVELNVVFRRFGEVVAFSVPLIPGTALMWVLRSSDRYFLVHLLDLSQAGVYSVAYSVASIIGFLYMPVGFVLFSHLSSAWNQGDRDRVRILIERTVSYYLLLSVPAVGGLYVLGDSLVALIATKAYVVNSSVILLIAFGVCMQGLFQLTNYVIFLVKKTHLNVVLLLIGSLINVLINIVSIPIVGVLGPALSTAVSFTLLGILGYWIARKYISLKIQRSLAAKIGLTSIVMVVLLKSATALTGFEGVVEIAVLFFSGVLSYAVGLRLLGVSWALTPLKLLKVYQS